MNALFLVILFGSLQGLVMAALLLFLPHNKKSNRLLAILLFIIALAGINLYIEDTGWYYSNTTIAIIHALVPMILMMPVGPLVFFYIKSTTDTSFSLGRKYARHFLPVIIDIVPQVLAFLFISGSLAGIMTTTTRSLGIFIDNYNVYSDIPRWLSLTIYLLASAAYLKSLNKANKLPEQKIKWLNSFIKLFLIFQAIWLPYLVVYIIPSYTNLLLEKFRWFPVYIPLSVLVYYIGLRGYMVSHLEGLQEKKSKVTSAPEIPTSVIQIILHSMENDKCYLNPLLDLPTLSKHTTLSTKTISVALNQHFRKNFNDFVNSYRVRECQSRIKDPAMGHLTIIGIASDCGFNAPSTFQRVFKQMTGMSPSEYRKDNNGLINNLHGSE